MATELHKNYGMVVRCPATDENIDVVCNFYFIGKYWKDGDDSISIVDIFHNGNDITNNFSYNHIKHIQAEILVQMLGDYCV